MDNEPFQDIKYSYSLYTDFLKQKQIKTVTCFNNYCLSDQ